MKNLIAILVLFFSVSVISVASINVHQNSTAISATAQYSSFVKDDKPTKKKKKKSSACTSEQKASSSCCSQKAASCCSKEKAKE